MKSFEHSRRLFAVLSLLLLAGCDDVASSVTTNSDLSGRLVVTGSSTVAPLVAELAKQFEQLHSGVRIDVQSGGSGKGIADARNGSADIGMVSRELKPDESDLAAYPIAADGVGIIVHSSNRIAQLSAQQIVDIFTGKIDHWKPLGGPDREIIVVHKAEGRATLEVFLKHFSLDNPQVKPDVIVGDNEHAVKTVAGAEGSIGYVSIGTAEANSRAGEPVRLLPTRGIAATSDNVASAKFPISRPLSLVTTGKPSQLAANFIKFCQSNETHDLIASQHFVAITD